MGLRDEIIERTINRVFPKVEERFKTLMEGYRGENIETITGVFEELIELLEESNKQRQKIVKILKAIENQNQKLLSLKTEQMLVEKKITKDFFDHD